MPVVKRIVRIYDRILIQGGNLTMEDIIEIDFELRNEEDISHKKLKNGKH